MFQMKDQNKTSGEELNEVEISHQPKKVFKVLIVMMLNELRRRMDEHMGILESETHKGLELENIKIFSERKYKELNRAKAYNNRNLKIHYK